jgi:hypothetical protein
MKTIDKWFKEHNVKSGMDGIVLVMNELREIASDIAWHIRCNKVYASNLKDTDLTFYVTITYVMYGYKVLYICAHYDGGRSERYDGISTPVEDIDDLKNVLQKVIDHFDIKTTGVVRQSLFDLED